MRRLLASLALIALGTSSTRGHDIPDARVDRSIQVTVRPRWLAIDYEVGLSELTLTQDLRALIGALPGADRHDWFEEYGRVSGPLNAKGLLVTVDGRPVELRGKGHDLTVEQHPRFTFHFEAEVPSHGRLMVKDTNYEASEGTSRLALRGLGGVVVHGDDLPGDVSLIPIRPVWQLTDAEERRTRQVEARYDDESGKGAIEASPVRPPTSTVGRSRVGEGLSELLDRSGVPTVGLLLIALALGAAHAIQPGHGKSLVAAASIGEGGGWTRGTVLALTITLAHVGGVLAVALALWATRSTRYPDINRGLAHGAGFVIAAIGFWRLGRHLGGYGEHSNFEETGDLGTRGLIGLGLAGGAVPCWDAVVLVLLAEAVGRLGLGLALLCAFSLGMAAVLVAVGLLAGRLRGFLKRRDAEGAWVRRLGMLSGLALAMIGVYLLIS